MQRHQVDSESMRQLNRDLKTHTSMRNLNIDFSEYYFDSGIRILAESFRSLTSLQSLKIKFPK